MEQNNNPWLTTGEAAAYLKVRPGTLLRWVRCGKVPSHRLSGTKRIVWRFLRAELDDMLCAPSVGPERTEHEGTTV
ncbi:MAG: helix-turn-helix domain-containing protein [Terriglobales bacterium]